MYLLFFKNSITDEGTLALPLPLPPLIWKKPQKKRGKNKDLHHKQWEWKLGGKKGGRWIEYSTNIENEQIVNHLYELSALFGNTMASYNDEENKRMTVKRKCFPQLYVVKLPTGKYWYKVAHDCD